MQVFRQTLGSDVWSPGADAHPPTDRELFTEFDAPVPAVLLARARVLLLVRLLARAPPELLVLLALGECARRSWFAAVRRDVCTLFSLGGVFADWSADKFIDWLTAAAADPSAMRRRVVQAFLTREARQVSVWYPAKSIVTLGEVFSCSACTYIATSKGALATHQFNCHGVVRSVRARILVPYCPACLQHFGTRPRALAHIADRSVRCRQYVHHYMAVEDEQLVLQADELDAALARSYSRIGRTRVAVDERVVRMAGPLPLGATLVGIDHGLLLKTQTSESYFCAPCLN